MTAADYPPPPAPTCRRCGFTHPEAEADCPRWPDPEAPGWTAVTYLPAVPPAPGLRARSGVYHRPGSCTAGAEYVVTRLAWAVGYGLRPCGTCCPPVLADPSPASALAEAEAVRRAILADPRQPGRRAAMTAPERAAWRVSVRRCLGLAVEDVAELAAAVLAAAGVAVLPAPPVDDAPPDPGDEDPAEVPGYDPGPEVDDEGGMSEYRYLPDDDAPGGAA